MIISIKMIYNSNSAGKRSKKPQHYFNFQVKIHDFVHSGETKLIKDIRTEEHQRRQTTVIFC